MFNKFFGLLLICIANVSYAETYIIAFMGANEAFDRPALIQYAQHKKAVPKIYSSSNTKQAITFINSKSKPKYILYGFSLGAVSVRQVLEHQIKYNKPMPIRTITIGAYHTTNVDFEKFKINYINYFDSSGKMNKGPGVYFDNVAHMQMQQKVTDILITEQ